MNEWWNSYFIPVEGGIYLVLRWLYFSAVSLFSESNPINFDFLTYRHIFQSFFGSLFVLFTENCLILVCLCNFVINVTWDLSICTRTNITYMELYHMYYHGVTDKIITSNEICNDYVCYIYYFFQSFK